MPLASDVGRALSFASGLLLVSACLPRTLPVRTANPDTPGQVSFTGLSKALDSQRGVRLLVIHGMGTHDLTYADDFLKELSTKLRLPAAGKCEIVDQTTNSYGAVSVVQRCILGAQDGRQLRAYVLTWSKVTEYFEDLLLKPDWDVYGKDRAAVNRKLKQELIDKGFSDAMLYVGTFGPSMRASVERAICVLLVDKTQADPPCDLAALITWNASHTRGRVSSGNAPIVLASHSLGSMMVLETLGDMISRGAGPASLEDIPADSVSSVAGIGARAFLEDLGFVALLANQLPLLYLARIPQAPGAVASSLSVLSPYLARRQTALPVVSFNDPNDLLTFPIPAGWRDRIAPEHGTQLKIINVRVTNGRNRWLGVAVNPGQAHTGYWLNKAVITYLVEGR